MAPPVCRSAWIERRLRGATVCMVAAAGCSPEPQPTDRRIEVVPSRAVAAMPPPAATPKPRLDAHPSPSPAAPPRRAFVDPPLPAELVDPPGLAPLPPRSTTDQQGEKP